MPFQPRAGHPFVTKPSTTLATMGLAALASLAACAPPAMSDADVLDRALGPGRSFVDLTHAISAESPWWPGPETSPFRHDTLRAHPNGQPSMAAIAVPEHFGTHLDAPVHGGEGRASVDELAPAGLIGPAVVVDVAQQVAGNLDYALSVDDVMQWETQHGPVPRGAFVLMRSGWGARWPDPERVFNQDADGVLHFPGFAQEAVRFLVEERFVAGVGVDTPSVDPGPAGDFPAHRAGNGAGILHLENVANLERLPEQGAWIVALPVKIQGGSGGPVRILGVLPGPAT